MIPKKVQAIIFDLFETLITEYDPDWQSRPSIAEQLGVDEEEFDEAWRSIHKKRMTGVLSDFSASLQHVCAILHYTPDPAIVHQLTQSRIAEKSMLYGQIDPEILHMLKALQSKGLKIALISNAALEEVLPWQNSDLAPFFDIAIFSYQVGYCKPEIEIYHLACDRLGVTPEHTVFVGDGAGNELLGAAQAGLNPLWASWFIDQWPNPEVWPIEKRQAYDQASQFPRLKQITTLIR